MKVDVAGPFGAGEVFSTTFRWAENRPRVAFALAVPGLGPLPGVTRFEGSWERQAYALLTGENTMFRERVSVLGSASATGRRAGWRGTRGPRSIASASVTTSPSMPALTCG